MCGRFQLYSDIQEIIKSYNIKYKEIDVFDKGDFYPSQNAPIVIQDNIRTLKAAKWGFDLKDKKNLVINARAESVMSKPMFKNSIYNARCIVPANLFYEWKDKGNNKKVKHKICLKDKTFLSLGGVFKLTSDEKGNSELSFVIITTAANDHMKDIYSRMPLIIDDEALNYWLDKGTSINIIEEILKSNVSRDLKIEKENKEEPFQQLRFF